VITISTVAGFAWWRHTRLPPRVNASEFENEMTASLVHELLRELATNNPPPVCFLAFGEGQTPPSYNFVAQFSGSYPALRGSGSSASPPIGKYFEVSNGRPGLILRLVRIRAITPSSHEVVVAFSNLPAGRNRFRYRVSKLAGDWSVANRKPE